MLKKVDVKNFMPFEKLAVDLSPNINVIIGENSLGKTILLKIILFLYSLVPNKDGKGVIPPVSDEFVVGQLKKIFDPSSEIVSFLNRNSNGTTKLAAELESIGSVSMSIDGKIAVNFSKGLEISKDQLPVFIPSKELMFLLPDLYKISNNYDLSIDSTVIDIIHKIAGLNLKYEKLFEPSKVIISKIEKILGGKFFVNKNFSMQFTDSGHVPNSSICSANIMAEGFRELGILSRLLETGTIILGKTGPLLWDEPAKHLNPSLMQSLAECIIDMALCHQQVILTTHNFLLMHWFKILSGDLPGINVRYHNLYRNEETSKIEILSTDDYSEISSNSIYNAYESQTHYEIVQSSENPKNDSS